MVSFSMDKLLPSLFPFSFSSFSPLLSPLQLHHFLFHFPLTPHFQLSHPPYQHHHFFQLQPHHLFQLPLPLLLLLHPSPLLFFSFDHLPFLITHSTTSSCD